LPDYLSGVALRRDDESPGKAIACLTVSDGSWFPPEE